jgi:alanine-glyoxylate transaminase/(R)-3-amino-2-methylpropionate-pyruvate transaminase
MSLSRGVAQTAAGARRLLTTSAAGWAPSQMPPCDFQPQPYTGLSYDETRAVRKEYLNPGILTYYKNPVLIHQGHMQWLFDHTGKRYLDLFSGIVTVGVGHCHPKVNKALKDQVDRLWHTTNIYMHPAIHEYGKKLASKFPGKLKVTFFTNSGSEANELAVLMARLHTGNFDIVSLRNGYHGAGPFVTSLTSLSTWKYPVPGNSGFLQAINPDVYRGPWGGANCRDSIAQTQRSCQCAQGECEAAQQYVRQLEDVLAHSAPKAGVAAFIAEYIQGVGGSVHLPRGYLKQVYEAIRAKGGVCIMDEVQTGFGRLGSHYWAFEDSDVEPDIGRCARRVVL